jgi:diaminopimelate decarboxylase|tara:strand:- start:156 stop:575 length:420 start_codon:yes stop_codon:yes gene_type:complete
LVSGNEILTALKAGFDPSKMIYNGNGKTIDELKIAIKNRILVNIDSEFDLQNIIYASKTVGIQARTLLRVNPDVDPEVHPYVSTGLANSKFGIQNQLLSKYLQKIRENDDCIKLLGVHCHIGSTIKDVNIFRDTAEIMI